MTLAETHVSLQDADCLTGREHARRQSSEPGCLSTSLPSALPGVRRAPTLLVGISPEQATAVGGALTSNGHIVIAAGDAAQAREVVGNVSPRLIIIGTHLAGCDGLQFCREVCALPAGHATAIIFLYESGSPADKLAAFSAGADDYITIPCDFAEVLLHIKALLAHAPNSGEPTAGLRAQGQQGALRLNAQTGEVSCGGYTTVLTPVETRMMAYLLACGGRAVSSADLARHVWDRAPAPANLALVRVHMQNLRAKLESCPTAPIILKTVTGLGYCLIGGDAGGASASA
jgi:DNA-binding response OmpR family regulator